MAASPFKYLCSKQHGSRSDCSHRSSLICVHAVCLYEEISPWHKHLHGQIHIFHSRGKDNQIENHKQQARESDKTKSDAIHGFQMSKFSSFCQEVLSAV